MLPGDSIRYPFYQRSLEVTNVTFELRSRKLTHRAPKRSRLKHIPQETLLTYTKNSKEFLEQQTNEEVATNFKTKNNGTSKDAGVLGELGEIYPPQIKLPSKSQVR